MKSCLLAIVVVALPMIGCGSSDSKPPIALAFQGTLTPAPGLSATDFTVWGPDADAPSAVSADGSWSASGHPQRTGILFATPKSGSAAAASLGAESGLYMTPAADNARLVKGSGGFAASTDAGTGHSGAVDANALDSGGLDIGAPIGAGAATSGYVVATEGNVAMDATTTVLSMLIMHPILAHPSSDVSAAQLRWMTARMASGWPCLAQAAAVYDADLLARVDFSADANFTTPFATCLDDVAVMPVTTPTVPTVPTGKQAMQFRSRHSLPVGAAGRYSDTGDQPVTVSVASAGIQVASFSQVSSNSSGVTMVPKTKNGTGLDYYYTVKQIDDSLTKQGAGSPMFVTPNQLEVHATTETMAAGFIPASSYFGYLDVVGNTLKKVTSLVTSTVIQAANLNVTLPSEHLFEARFFSGGFGFGVTGDAYAFATTSFSAEHDAAFYQNVTMAVTEVVALIPGAGEILAEGNGGKILQAVVQKTVVDLRALLAAKGTDVTGDDVYNLIYGILKTALDSIVNVATSDAQAGLGKQLLGWLVGGGKKVIKTVIGLPGKAAKGGALGNRAFRLANPESVMEYTLVAVTPAAPADAGAPPQSSLQTDCSVTFAFIATWSDFPTNPYQDGIRLGVGASTPGTYSGASYSRSWTDGTMTFTLTPKGDAISTVNASATTEDYGIINSYALQANNLPLTDDVLGAEYSVTGVAACDHVTTITAVQTIPPGDSTSPHSLIAHSCDAKSFVRVTCLP